MVIADPIADMITRIKNASAVNNAVVTLPLSKLRMAIAELLVKEGFLKSVNKRGKKVTKYIDLELSYSDGEPGVRGVKRMSHLSKRTYIKADEIRPVKFGQGILVVSTSKGLMTDREARKAKLGGESLFKIW